MVFGIYCRKSVLSDKGESVENQMEMCRSYVINKFGEFRQEYIEADVYKADRRHKKEKAGLCCLLPA